MIEFSHDKHDIFPVLWRAHTHTGKCNKFNNTVPTVLCFLEDENIGRFK